MHIEGEIGRAWDVVCLRKDGEFRCPYVGGPVAVTSGQRLRSLFNCKTNRKKRYPDKRFDMHMCMCRYKNISIHVYIYICRYASICVYIYTYMNTHIHMRLELHGNILEVVKSTTGNGDSSWTSDPNTARPAPRELSEA